MNSMTEVNVRVNPPAPDRVGIAIAPRPMRWWLDYGWLTTPGEEGGGAMVLMARALTGETLVEGASLPHLLWLLDGRYGTHMRVRKSGSVWERVEKGAAA